MPDRRTFEERRATKERRRARDRKRATTETHTVIEIAGSELRAVTLQRTPDDKPDQVRGMKVRWRNEATSLNTDVGLRELTEALHVLADQHDLPITNLQFVLGGEFCVTKAVRGTTEEVRSELQKLEQRSRLYLMLGPGEKVTVSRSKPFDARHSSAIAAVCNKQTLDTIHEAATHAGMPIDSIEPALVSSSRAIGRLVDVPNEPCLLIHMDQSAVELGICHGGSLLLDYRPGGRTNPEELLELVDTHLSRLQRHVGRQLNQPPPRLKRIYLCGEKAAVERAFPVFSASKKFEVQKVDPAKIQATWEFTKTLDDSSAVPALGALLNAYLPDGEHDVPNFMEHIIASTREPLQPVLIRSLVPLAAVLLIAATLFAVNFRKQQQNDALRRQLDSLVTVQARDRELRLQQGAARAKLIQLDGLASQLQSLPADGVVARIGHCMPSDVWLTRMVVNDMSSVQLNGSSYLEDFVFDFVNWLDNAPGLEDVALRSTRPGQSAAGPAVDFNIELNLGDWNVQVEEVARNE